MFFDALLATQGLGQEPQSQWVRHMSANPFEPAESVKSFKSAAKSKKV